MWEWLHFNTASYFSGDASLFNSKLYLVPLNLFAATRDKRKSARFTHIQSEQLKSRTTCSAKAANQGEFAVREEIARLCS